MGAQSTQFRDGQGAVMRGTLIETPDGPRLAERLRPGDLVMTQNDGAQPIMARRLDRVRYGPGDNAARPIEIKRGALGAGRPTRRLVLTPDQVVCLYQGGLARTRADLLLNLPGVRRMRGREQAGFVQLFFATPQIMCAEGVSITTGMPERKRKVDAQAA